MTVQRGVDTKKEDEDVIEVPRRKLVEVLARIEALEGVLSAEKHERKADAESPVRGRRPGFN